MKYETENIRNILKISTLVFCKTNVYLVLGPSDFIR